MTQSVLRKSICDIFFAYVLIYLDFNFSVNGHALNILPDWAGYAILFSQLGALTAEQPSLRLLRPFALLLGINGGYDWVNRFTGDLLPGLPSWLSLIVGLISMYFHFQLFTDLADLVLRRGTDPEQGGPPRPDQVRGLLTARMVQVLLHTVIFVAQPFIQWLQQHGELPAILYLLIYFLVILVILRQLYRLRRLFPRFPIDG